MITRARLAVALTLLALAALLAAACSKTERRDVAMTTAEGARPLTIRVGKLQPGKYLPSVHVDNRYQGNAYAISEGQRLFAWYNCSGCHAGGGGGMGPALMDDKWIYGDDPANIYATIVEGRPDGMPSYGGHIPEAQVWQLVAYVKTLNPMQQPIGSAPGPRKDDMQASEGRPSR